MHQTESPPTKIYEQDKANDWSESMTRDNYFKLAPKAEIGICTLWWHVGNWDSEKGEQLAF